MIPVGRLGTVTIRVLLIIEERRATAQPCTVRAIAAAADLSTTTCHWHLTRLRSAGLIAWDPDLANSIHPLVTVVAAG